MVYSAYFSLLNCLINVICCINSKSKMTVGNYRYYNMNQSKLLNHLVNSIPWHVVKIRANNYKHFTNNDKYFKFREVNSVAWVIIFNMHLREEELKSYITALIYDGQEELKRKDERLGEVGKRLQVKKRGITLGYSSRGWSIWPRSIMEAVAAHSSSQKHSLVDLCKQPVFWSSPLPPCKDYTFNSLQRGKLPV